jgi:hypothetical protein
VMPLWRAISSSAPHITGVSRTLVFPEASKTVRGDGVALRAGRLRRGIGQNIAAAISSVGLPPDLGGVHAVIGAVPVHGARCSPPSARVDLCGIGLIECGVAAPLTQR